MEVEFAGDQEDDSLDGGESSEAASASLCGLEQAVNGFEKAVGLAGLRPGDDALQVAAHERGDLLHWLNLGAHDAGTPMLKHGTHDVDLFAIKDLTQLLLVGPRPSGAHGSEPGDQGIEVGGRLGLEAGSVLEQRPAQALERFVSALLDAAHLVYGGAGVGDDVELVESDACLWQVLGAAFDEGGRHVDAHRLDSFGRATVGIEVGGERFDGRGIAPLGDEQDPARHGIGRQRDVVVTAGARGLVNGERLDLAEISHAQGKLHVALAHRHHAVGRLAHDARHRRKRHLLREHQDQRLEEQREPGQATGEIRLDQTHRAVGQLNPRGAHSQDAFMLEEVQVPVGLGHGVMHRMQALVARCSKARTGFEVDQYSQGLGFLIELDRGHTPRIGNSQRRFKQLGSHESSRLG